jgi:hypothetical protein
VGICEHVQFSETTPVVPGNFSRGIDTHRNRQYCSRRFEGRDCASPVTHKTVVSICGIDPKSGDLSFVVDARGRGILCAGDHEYPEISVLVPYKASKNIREPAGPIARNLALVVDARRVCGECTWDGLPAWADYSFGKSTPALLKRLK